MSYCLKVLAVSIPIYGVLAMIQAVMENLAAAL